VTIDLIDVECAGGRVGTQNQRIGNLVAEHSSIRTARGLQDDREAIGHHV
jgi:hypothetical protein